MASHEPKVYQSQVLDSVETYFRACHELPSASHAFTHATDQLWSRNFGYRPPPGCAPDMPYFCLRVPTGGGKTWLAAKCVALANAHLLRTDHSVVLWLVPSKPIREQTLKALRDPGHPYHAALREAGAVNVLDLDEAKGMTPATLDTATVVIVATRQAFQVEDEDNRKVYESSGALMAHFQRLAPEQRAGLLADGDSVPYSLANVLRLRRPFVIVDEAHNSRTPLAFDTLAKFDPSGILELTATPDTEATPSNVLHSVSAAELKAEHMVKLPIVLHTEPDWQQCLADAIARREALHQLAEVERLQGAAYLRPLALIQSEPRRQGVETLDYERVRAELVGNHRIPAEEIAVATGEEKGLDRIAADYPQGIADPACPVKYIITQKALAEGWDCPSAYVLVSMAALHSATAVEQLLGRVLRQPGARRRSHPALNQSYAFVVSRDFAATAKALRDRLVEGAGFERKDVAQFVAPAKPEQGTLDLDAHPGRAIPPVKAPLPEQPDLAAVPKPVRDKVQWDSAAQTLTVAQPLSAAETVALQEAVASEAARHAIAEAAAASRQAMEHFQVPAETGERFEVPQLAVRIQGVLALFDDPELLDYPWNLALHHAAPTPDDLSFLDRAGAGSGGVIDVSEHGKVTHCFIGKLQRDLGLSYRPERWDETQLAAWLCRNLPEPSATHDSKLAFVAGWMRELYRQDGFDLARATRQRFAIRSLIEQRLRALRKAVVKQAYQATLFGEGREARVSAQEDFRFAFNPYAYAPGRDYDGRFGDFGFRKHYYGRIGDFDTPDEFLCAVQLDAWAQQGRIDFWVRNLVRKEGCSFFLQKADGRFYPDFVCRLPGGAALAVEYKGDRWEEAKDDREIGGLWAELSGGKCRFVMVRDRRWDWIEGQL
jgi:type III restriction enzyme